VLAGELTLIAGGKQTVLKANDACFIGPNERREIVNRGNDVVTMLGRSLDAAAVTPMVDQHSPSCAGLTTRVGFIGLAHQGGRTRVNPEFGCIHPLAKMMDCIATQACPSCAKIIRRKLGKPDLRCQARQ
jgi:hypothetical protein